MKCVFCKQGDTRPGEATVTLHRRKTVVVVKEVPADICENCGDYYPSDSVAEKVMAKAEEAVRNGAEVEILLFTA